MGILKISDKQRAARKRLQLARKTGKKTPAQIRKMEEMIDIWEDRIDIDPITVREEAWKGK